MSRPVAIYALVDPRTKLFMYIGQSVEPDKRFKAHLKKTGKLKSKWIGELKRIGLVPILKVIKWVAMEKANESEAKTILRFKRVNPSLLNLTPVRCNRLSSFNSWWLKGYKTDPRPRWKKAGISGW